ncbi:nucleotidyl transferase AbiEii/AbiGii toxin family protein [Roseibium sp. RKSG952]|uniref:nucleotidyl transferase AbiEii/AbiGii toxin family protein n=1 Tax=Roseibium sp. RKSG952 TaxID=2529384 RepID=UPI0012BC6C1D|nr:nucleotidyl transferase AbiEii/AbiGii toxin family protein [Roseibium sp. RKSG952]MTH94983.1 nucleotidyl transferase AbiEii/AbiGii toxin family protein [Roseibium sp. RKSG952]
MSGKNVGASVYERLKITARETGVRTDLLLRRYVQERLLYRLSVSPERESYCVKGGVLMSAYNDGRLLRPTEDIDFNGFDPNASVQTLRESLIKIFDTDVQDDGVRFDIETMKIEKDRVGIIPGGKVVMKAFVHTARVELRVDVGFGNPITPEVRTILMPTLLDKDQPRPMVLAYPMETVVAEKVHAMVQFGFENTRLKDFYDLLRLSEKFEFEGDFMIEAMRNTFAAQNRELPETPLEVFDEEFVNENGKRWTSFLKKIDDDSGVPFDEVVESVSDFVTPIIAAANDKHSPGVWVPGERWSENPDRSSRIGVAPLG